MSTATNDFKCIQNHGLTAHISFKTVVSPLHKYGGRNHKND